jgi:hypothetical protein
MNAIQINNGKRLWGQDWSCTWFVADRSLTRKCTRKGSLTGGRSSGHKEPERVWHPLSHAQVTGRTDHIFLWLSNTFAPRLPEERSPRVVPASCDATPPEASGDDSFRVRESGSSSPSFF